MNFLAFKFTSSFSFCFGGLCEVVLWTAFFRFSPIAVWPEPFGFPINVTFGGNTTLSSCDELADVEGTFETPLAGGNISEILFSWLVTLVFVVFPSLLLMIGFATSLLLGTLSFEIAVEVDAVKN